MDSVQFKDQTRNLGRPSSMTEEECGSLWIKDSVYLGKYPMLESVWELSEEDLKLIMETKRIRLKVVSHIMPPVSLSVEKPES